MSFLEPTVPEYPRYWEFVDSEPVRCSKDKWLSNRTSKHAAILAQHDVDPGLCIVTAFIGFQKDSTVKPTMFQNSVMSDLGNRQFFSDDIEGAVIVHNLELSRALAIVEINNWAAYAQLKNPAKVPQRDIST